MFVLEKIKNSKTLKVKIDGVEIDQIHYDDINSLCDILNKYYYNELMQEIDCCLNHFCSRSLAIYMRGLILQTGASKRPFG